MDYSILGWLTRGAPNGGYFQVHQLWYQFATRHGSIIFLQSKSLICGIGEYEEQSLQIGRSYKLGYALVNKISVYGRMRNQITSSMGLVHQGLRESIEHGNPQIVETFRGIFKRQTT
jgi:hypothetical protein